MTLSGEKSPGKPRASSRGNTGGTSVVRSDWAYSVARQFIESSSCKTELKLGLVKKTDFLVS